LSSSGIVKGFDLFLLVFVSVFVFPVFLFFFSLFFGGVFSSSLLGDAGFRNLVYFCGTPLFCFAEEVGRLIVAAAAMDQSY
jgi:hypothetical protein